MSGAFDAAWLDLREPVDHRSRASDLLPPLRAWWEARGACRVLDLGCGTGSNLRYLAPALPLPQTWTLLDRDEELLARIRPPMRRGAGGEAEAPAPPDALTLRPLRRDLEDAGPAAAPDNDLVTASALLDLVPEGWLRRLADACADAGCAVLFALTYDGIIEWHDQVELDLVVRDAVNEHQRRDKGLGPALGPDAGTAAERLFRERGYETRRRPSPWKLGPHDAELARALITGWASATVEQRPDLKSDVRRWAERRSAAVTEHDFGLTVGHLDLLALPPERPPESP